MKFIPSRRINAKRNKLNSNSVELWELKFVGGGKPAESTRYGERLSSKFMDQVGTF